MPRSVRVLKNFDTFDYPHKYMFMACRPECYPIRRHTLDMWIDYMDCIDYSETESRFLPELIHPYLRENAYVHGVTFVSKDTLYFQKLRTGGTPSAIIREKMCALKPGRFLGECPQ